MSSENLTTKNNDELSLKELVSKAKEWWVYLFSRILVIILVGIIGASLGFLYAYLKKPVYTATTTFVLEDEKGGGGGLGGLVGLASMAGVDLGSDGGGIFQGDNILDLYKSRKMIVKTLLTPISYKGQQQLLVQCYIDFKGLKKDWKDKKDLINFKFDTTLNDANNTIRLRLQDSLLSSFVDDINKNILSVVKPDKKTNIIHAKVSSTDEFFSKSFNENIVKNVNDFYVQTKTLKSNENISILQQKTDSVRAVMNGAIYSAAAISDATPNLNPTKMVKRVAPVQKSQFSAETNKIILGSLVQNLEMSKIALRKETPLIQVIDEPVFPLERMRLSKALSTVIGGIVGGFIMIIILVCRRLLKQL